VDYKKKFFRDAEQLGLIQGEELSDFAAGLSEAIAMYVVIRLWLNSNHPVIP
jgi:hypothetical protein